MRLTSWRNSPDGKIWILKTDVAVAKNYLTWEELDSLGRIVNTYLEIVEDRALRKIPTTMEDWARRLDMFLELTEREILQDNGSVKTKIAKTHAESEFENSSFVGKLSCKLILCFRSMK